jgi:hypothetical protein
LNTGEEFGGNEVVGGGRGSRDRVNVYGSRGRKGIEKMRWQKNGVIVVIYPPVEAWPPRQEISTRIRDAGDMMKCEVILL